MSWASRTGHIFLTSNSSCFVGCHWSQGVDSGSWVKVSSWFFFDLQQLRYGISDHFALSVLCFLVVDAETAISYLVVDPISLFSYWLLTGKSCPIFHYIHNEKIRIQRSLQVLQAQNKTLHLYKILSPWWAGLHQS